ncbi:MAG: ankyrin repeat domain-containing protein [Spirochaetia bacterium]|jgi:ankyrin repeat protein
MSHSGKHVRWKVGRSLLILCGASLILFAGCATVRPQNVDLFQLAANASAKVLQENLRKGADLHARDAYGRTLLMAAAAENRDPAVISVLVRAGAEINARDNDGWTALMVAVENNPNTRVVAALIQVGANVNEQKKDGDTALMRAAHADDSEGITLLLGAGAAVNAQNQNGMTALMWAAQDAKSLEVIHKLLQAGAAVNPRTRVSGKTALILAAEHWQDPEAVSMLLKAGADVNECDSVGNTALMQAAWYALDPQVVSLLLQAGALVNARDDVGETALMEAVRNKNSPETVFVLLKEGAEVNLQDKDGCTALMYAARDSEDPAVVSALLRAGARTSLRDVSGKAAFDYGEANGALKSAQSGQDLLESLRPQVEFIARFPPALSLFYKHYDDHPIGTLVINNPLAVPLSNIKVQFFIKHYMDDPKQIDVAGLIAPNSSEQVDIFALFTDAILGTTEGTKVSAELVIDYRVNGQDRQEKRIETVEILGRNAMTWDDDRKAAAYVTAKDPAVLQFARSIVSQVRTWETRSINRNLEAAIALHEALDIYGINYVPNPVSPYSVTSKNKELVDFLQFPRETLQYRAGDCSDISILYAALLQAVGINTAFITIPGHIFIALSADIPPDQAESSLIPAQLSFVRNGSVWVPVEITLRHQGFSTAWEMGAKEWNAESSRGQAGFYPLQEAWKEYQAVGLPGAAEPMAVPQWEQVLAAYRAESQKYIDQATVPLVAGLQAEIQKAGSLSAMNRLGVFYARYGYPQKAEAQFKTILAKNPPYLPALLNLGNVYFLREDWKAALGCYQRVREGDPTNPHVQLALAMVNRELKSFSEMKRAYDRLRELDEALAAQYAYLGEGTEKGPRGAEIEPARREVVWESD